VPLKPGSFCFSAARRPHPFHAQGAVGRWHPGGLVRAKAAPPKNKKKMYALRFTLLDGFNSFNSFNSFNFFNELLPPWSP
jgi:hypothetical protein